MRLLLALIFVGGCGGPSSQQVIESPSATAPADHSEAPPASTSDLDRERLKQSFDDMQNTQNAYREAGEQQGAPPPPPLSGQPAPATTKKKAPVEQAPAPTKKAPVEQAPK
jgi:hypothetical protein